MNNNIFNKLKDLNPDTGIAAYLDDNIGIKMNEKGFYKEYILNESIEIKDEVLFSSTHYPFSRNETDIGKELFSNIENIQFDKTLGFYKELLIGHVSEGTYRLKGSSGGFGTWILKELFDKNMIDAVIHVGEGTDKLFEYKISNNIEEILNGAKTKYYPVELSKVLKKVKESKKRYAIVGIPSFISSIRLLQTIDQDIKNNIVFTIGLVCGHQKSSNFSEYLGWQMGIKPGDLKAIDFRVKLAEYPANIYGISVKGSSGNEIIMPKTELDGQDWGRAYFKKSESDYVDDVMNETADITLGDAWLPEYNQDYLGNNILIVRNTKIFDLINVAVKENRLKLEKVDKEKIIQSQKSHIVHTQDELQFRIDNFLNINDFFRRPSRNKLTLSRKLIQIQRKNISEKSNWLYLKAKSENNVELMKSKLKFNNLA